MGMYTEFHFNIQLREDTPKQVFEILRVMLGDSSDYIQPEHDLFRTPRWEWMLRSDSCYFDAQTCSTLTKDEYLETWFLGVRCNLKNYDNEIEKFVDWIKPYVEGYPGKFLGFYRHEESEEPTLIYM